ncbi:MAG: GNAT family N-acetyltransferase [Patescibacteria group bacterium]|nr:MAG: GNAT family N-acetyltransferase [Patescibacteria group bacterium]
MDIRFTNELHPSRHDELVDYLRGPRLGMPKRHYPDYDDWLGRVHAELGKQQKRAIVALDGGNVVGAVVYQRHKQQSDVLEIRNVTVRPDMRGRYVASFLVRNLEIEGLRDFPGVTRILCDAKRENREIRLFLLQHRYVVAGALDLYGLGAGEDLVFSKSLLVRA